MGIVHDSTQNLSADTGESFVKNITTATVTLVKSGNATLNGIVVNSHTGGSLVIFNGATTVLANTTIKFGTLSLGTPQLPLDYFGARFADGLVVYTIGTVDITVLYK